MPVELPSGFAIDTVLSPDRVRVQWPATTAPAAGVLPNLGFESGDASFLKGAGWAISTGGLVEAGTFSAKYTGTGQSTLAHETLAPVTAGTSITASARVSKGSNRQDFAGGAVVLQWFDNTLASLGFNVGNVVNTGTSAFQTSTVTANAPTGSAFVRLAVSATRDVKGRATDAVTIDTLSWNHTFTLGGTGPGGSTAPTGPITFTFRVRDANGCEAVATRTINAAPPVTGTWVLFGRTVSPETVDWYVTSTNPNSFDLATRVNLPLAPGPSAFAGVKSAQVIDGVFIGVTNNAQYLRATSPTGPYSLLATGNFSGAASNAAIIKSGSRIVVDNGFTGVYSTDLGLNWTNSSGDSFDIIAADSGGVIVGVFGSVFQVVRRSTDNGSSFGTAGNLPEVTDRVYNIVSDGSNFCVIYRRADGSLRSTRSTDDGDTWSTPVTIGSTAAGDRGFAIAFPTGRIVTVTPNGETFYSTDFGQSWTTGPTIGSVFSLSLGGATLVATGEASLTDNVRVSTDGGVNWGTATLLNALPSSEFTLDNAAFFPA